VGQRLAGDQTLRDQPGAGWKCGKSAARVEAQLLDHQQLPLDYGRFSKNDELDSVNNQITHAWVAVSDGDRGLLVAQNADIASGMAFCPLRTRKHNAESRVRFNPFGTYWGKQYRYATADTGLGNLLATTFSASDHIRPYAPSYNGRAQEFNLLIAPMQVTLR
jgi:hypothetical protein